jgi:hypothetical protein
MTAPVAIERPASMLHGARNVLRARPFVMALFIAVVPILLAIFAFTPRYETNDDVTMHLISAGLVFDDQPDEHLLFTNVLIGLALKNLYLEAPDVPWYGLYQLVTLTLATCAAVYALLRVNPSIGQTVVALLYVVVGVVPFVAELQFTKTAFLACFSGLLLFLAPLRGQLYQSQGSRIPDVLGCALLVWGSLIRFESSLLALIMAAPVALAGAIAAPGRAARRAVPLALAIALCVGLNQFNQAYYARGRGWENFYSYNALRAEFTDYQHFPYTPETSQAFQAAGWSEIDYWMLRYWFFADRERYGLSRMQQIASTVPRAGHQSLTTTAFLLVKNLPRFPLLIVLMLAVPCAAILSGTGWRSSSLPAVLFGLPWLISVILCAYFWIPVRVAFPLFAGAVAGAALRSERGDRSRAAVTNTLSDDNPSAEPGSASASRHDARTGAAIASSEGAVETIRSAAHVSRSRKPEFGPPGGTKSEAAGSAGTRIVRIGAGVLAVCLMIASLVYVAREDGVHTSQHEGVKRVMGALNPRTEKLFVLWGEWFPLEALVYPLKDTRPLRNFRCLPMGLLAPTPIFARRMSDFHISDVYEAICTRPAVYLVTIPQLMELYRHYVFDHYKIRTEARPIFSSRSDPRFFGQDKTFDIQVFHVRQVGTVPAREPEQQPGR